MIILCSFYSLRWFVPVCYDTYWQNCPCLNKKNQILSSWCHQEIFYCPVFLKKICPLTLRAVRTHIRGLRTHYARRLRAWWTSREKKEGRKREKIRIKRETKRDFRDTRGKVFIVWNVRRFLGVGAVGWVKGEVRLKVTINP